MLNVGLSGCNGTMGRIIHDLLLEQENVQVVFGIDIEPERYENDYPVFTDPYEINVDCDVIIDFSKPENIDHLFDRFYRTDESRNSKTGGYGIGLSVAKAVVEAHHGKIMASSEDGNSLLITVILKI